MTEEKMCGDFPLEKELLAPYYHILQAKGKRLRVSIVLAFNHWLKVPGENIRRYFVALDMLYNAGLLVLSRSVPNKVMDNQTAIRMELNKIILLLAMQCIRKLILSARQKKKRNRKIWVRDWISRRQDLGASAQLLTEMIDDIQDNTLVRRGLPSAHCVYGLPATINASFHAIFLALKEFQDLDPKARELFTEHFLDVIRGQGLEIYWRDKFICPSEEEYKDMIRQKTTTYFLMAVRIIQLSSEDKRDYENLILLLGEYYQIRDDYCNLRNQEALEEWPSTDDAYAKETCFCDDLTEGKFSLPIIHALRSQTSESEEIRDILRQRTRDVEKKRRCLYLLEKVGSLQYTRDTLRSLDIAVRAEVARLGGNPKMESLLDDFLSWQDTATISPV